MMAHPTIDAYITAHYSLWHEYAGYRCFRNGVPGEAEDILGDTLCVMLCKPETALLAMIDQRCGEYTRLDLFLFTAIKFKALARYKRHARRRTRERPIDMEAIRIPANEQTDYSLLERVADIDFILTEPHPGRRMREARSRKDKFNA